MYYLFIKKYCKNKDWIKYAEKHERKEIDVTCDRSNRKRTKDPSQQIQRGVVPSWLLSPWIDWDKIKEWLWEINLSNEDQEDLKEILKKYRKIISGYVLPMFELSNSTNADVALDVFINMNTNSKPLATYDIIVAQVEKATQEPWKQWEKLSEYEDKLKNTQIERFISIRDYILDMSCYLQDKKSSRENQLKLVKHNIIKNRDKLTAWTNSLVKFLEDNKIYDHQRLPTTAPIGVIGALFGLMPEIKTKSNDDAFINKTLRKYLWTSFFTNRYENSSSSKAWSDFEWLLQYLDPTSKYYQDDSIVPIFNEPLVTLSDIEKAWRPKGRWILARAILNVSLQFGAPDLKSNGNNISEKEIKERHYHHIYPQSLLKENDIKETDLALNCVLLRWKDNQEFSKKHPNQYLREITDQSNVRKNLRSNFIPSSIYNLPFGGIIFEQAEELSSKQLKIDYDHLIKTRARFIQEAMNILCQWDKVWDNNPITQHENINTSKLKRILEGKTKREEDGTIEFKSSLGRETKNDILNTNLQKKREEYLEEAVIKTIQAFMNSKWWILIIGIKDDGEEIYGLENDYSTFKSKPNRDWFSQHLVNLFSNYIWQQYWPRIDISLERLDEKDIAIIKVDKASWPVYLKKEIKSCDFYIRVANTTQRSHNDESNDIIPVDIEQYIKENWW